MLYQECAGVAIASAPAYPSKGSGSPRSEPVKASKWGHDGCGPTRSSRLVSDQTI